MQQLVKNIAACHKCIQGHGAKRGAAACPIDGGDIAAHAQAHDCPAEKFPSRGLGDTIAKVTHAIGVKKCGGCGGRQVILNQVAPYPE